MKRAALLLFFATCFIWNGSIQAQSSILISPGATFRVEEKAEGLHLRAYYALPKWFSIGPEFSFFKPEKYDGDPDGDGIYTLSKRQVWAADLNIHIDIKLGNLLTIYPLIGGNVTHVYEINSDRVDGGGFTDDPSINNEFGLNIGGGLHLCPRQMGPFVEYKQTLGSLKQQTVTAGFTFRFQLGEKEVSWVDDHEDPRLK